MAAKVLFKLNQKGVAQLITSPEFQADIMRRAGAVSAAAGPGHDVRNATSDRARAIIMTQSEQAKRAEAEQHTLTTAIQAGRV